jgi:hypothetical protein
MLPSRSPGPVSDERTVRTEAELFVKAAGRQSVVLHREAHAAERRSIEETAGGGHDQLPADTGAAGGGVYGDEVDEPFAVSVDLTCDVADDAPVPVVGDKHEARAVIVAVDELGGGSVRVGELQVVQRRDGRNVAAGDGTQRCHQAANSCWPGSNHVGVRDQEVVRLGRRPTQRGSQVGEPVVADVAACLAAGHIGGQLGERGLEKRYGRRHPRVAVAYDPRTKDPRATEIIVPLGDHRPGDAGVVAQYPGGGRPGRFQAVQLRLDPVGIGADIRDAAVWVRLLRGDERQYVAELIVARRGRHSSSIRASQVTRLSVGNTAIVLDVYARVAIVAMCLARRARAADPRGPHIPRSRQNARLRSTAPRSFVHGHTGRAALVDDARGARAEKGYRSVCVWLGWDIEAWGQATGRLP